MMKHKKIKSSAEERILAAATKIFVTKGLAGARARNIATEANVNPAMLYYYYSSKENLFSLVFENALEKLFPPADYLKLDDLDIFSKIKMLCDELIEIQIANPYLSIFIFDEIEKDTSRLKIEIWLQQKEKIKLFIREIQRNINNKTIRKIEPVLLFMNIFSLCIFPMVARPLLAQLFDVNDSYMTDYMQRRKTAVKNMIINSIKKVPHH
ncbi:MAG: TetR/AcrR family transcriptional regulator [Lacibacter sp.]|jgi:AcrR family transcriptional regulator